MIFGDFRDAKSPVSVQAAVSTGRLLSCFAAATVLALTVPAAVDAFRLGPIRPGPKLSYYVDPSAKSRTWEIRMAARAWNLSGAKVGIREVKSRRSAMIIVVGAKIQTAFTGTNPGTHGGVAFPIWITVTTLRARDPVNVAMIMAHEFGHTLGIAHTKGCVLMNPASQCAFSEGTSDGWNCRMLRPDDVRGVASLWGGRWAPQLPKMCPRKSSGPTANPAAANQPPRGGPLTPPSNFGANYDPSGDGTPVVITFRNTTSSLLGSVHVYWNDGPCPKSEKDENMVGAHFLDPATPGEQVRIDLGRPWFTPDSTERGFCVAAWSISKDNYKSARVTATFVAPLRTG